MDLSKLSELNEAQLAKVFGQVAKDKMPLNGEPLSDVDKNALLQLLIERTQ